MEEVGSLGALNLCDVGMRATGGLVSTDDRKGSSCFTSAFNTTSVALLQGTSGESKAFVTALALARAVLAALTFYKAACNNVICSIRDTFCFTSSCQAALIACFVSCSAANSSLLIVPSVSVSVHSFALPGGW